MSLPQLIGLDCVACRRGIASVIDGTFCGACGNPVHQKCLKTTVEPPEISTAISAMDGPAAAIRAAGNPTPLPADKGSPADRCEKCGGDPESYIAKEVCRERGAAKQADRRATAASVRGAPVAYPVSKVCPGCGNAEFTRVRPQGWVAFAWDRVCSSCGTRYSPPTPIWAALVFLAAGLLLAAFGGFALLGAMTHGGMPLCEVFLGATGMFAIIHGIRSLIRPGKV